MAISKELVDQIKEANPIVDVARDYFDLRFSGEVYQAHCTHGSDSSPSLTFFPKSNTFYCFGCGAGSKDTTGRSDVIAFIQWVESCGYVEAVHKLADRAGIKVESNPTLDRLYANMWTEIEQAHEELLKNEQYMSYLAGRGIEKAEVNKWMLGLKDQKIVYPLKDNANRWCSYSVRRSPFVESTEPKYKNAGNTAIHNRSKSLYGIHSAAKMVTAKNYFILVEGYNDVIVLQKFGLPAVAAMGSCITEEQALLMKRYTTNVILFLDGDEAGVDGMHRSAKRLINQGFTVKIVVDFVGDPDEIALREKENFYKWLNARTTLYGQHIVSTMLKKYTSVVSDANVRLYNTFGKFMDSVAFSEAEKELYKKQIEEVVK